MHNPPLRERVEDIELLSQHFLSKFAHQFEMDKKQISKKTIAQMQTYSWPGNIRELENKLMQATLLSTEHEIMFDDLKLKPVPKMLSSESSIDTVVSHAALDVMQNNQDILNTSLPSQLANNIANDAIQTHQPHTHHSQSIHSQSNQALSPSAWSELFSETFKKLLLSVNKRTILNISIGSAVEATLLKMAHD